MNKTLSTALVVLLGLAGNGASHADDSPPAAATPAAMAPVAAAAPAPAVAASQATRRAWQYSPVQRPAVPAVKARAWVRTPVDSFVLAGLEARGLKPSADADRATFIRRATLDAWGLIPTPDEVKAFVA